MIKVDDLICFAFIIYSDFRGNGAKENALEAKLGRSNGRETY